MNPEREPGELYWSLVEPVWRSVRVSADPDDFLERFAELRPAVRNLFAAHWCQSEIRNGGSHQFFTNPTGVLAPEALEAFRVIGLAEWADILEDAVLRPHLPA